MDKSKQVKYYDAFISRQISVGVNKRHKSIEKKLLQQGLSKNMHILEIGCGIGTVSGLILKHIPNGSLLALDLSPDSIEVAKQRLSKYRNAEFVAADVMEYDIQRQFDMIVLPDVLEHIPMEHHHDLFVKLKQLLKPGGKIVIHIPNPWHLDWCRAQGMEMQIIDQALFLPLIVDNLKDTGLFVSYLEIYSIWVKEGDYQFMILEKTEKFKNFTQIVYQSSFFQRVKKKFL